MATIGFLGDSLTWGGYGGNYVEHVREMMPDHTIINAGVGGDTVVNLLRRVENVLERHDFDALFIMVGGNDATSYTMPKTRGYYRKAKALDGGQVSPEQFVAAYRELIETVQAAFVNPLIGLAPTEYSRELVAAKREYNDLTRNLAQEMRVPLLDLDALFTPEHPIEREPITLKFIQQIGDRGSRGWNDYEKERADFGYTYTFDGLHLMPAAAQRFAEYIVPFLHDHL